MRASPSAKKPHNQANLGRLRSEKARHNPSVSSSQSRTALTVRLCELRQKCQKERRPLRVGHVLGHALTEDALEVYRRRSIGTAEPSLSRDILISQGDQARRLSILDYRESVSGLRQQSGEPSRRGDQRRPTPLCRTTGEHQGVVRSREDYERQRGREEQDKVQLAQQHTPSLRPTALFHRYALCEVARLVHVETACFGDVVGEEL